MKLRIILVLAMIAASFSLLSCVTSHELHVEVTCDQFTQNPNAISEFEIEIGDKIYVKLCSNPTTGFKWQYETIGEVVLQEEDYDFEEPVSEGTVGGAGKEVWTFEAIESGSTKIRMEYSRQWEGGEKAEWTYTMNVTVK